MRIHRIGQTKNVAIKRFIVKVHLMFPFWKMLLIIMFFSSTRLEHKVQGIWIWLLTSEALSAVLPAELDLHPPPFLLSSD